MTISKADILPIEKTAKNVNHFKKKCTSTKKEVNVLTAEKSDMGMNDLFVGMIADDLDSSKGWFKSYKVMHKLIEKKIKFKIDTGAQANVMPLKYAQDLNADIQDSKARLFTYSNQILPNAEKTTLKLDSSHEVNELVFELVNDDVVPMLGLKACVDLELVKRVDSVNNKALLDKYTDCFQGIGCLGREQTIQVNP